MRPARACCEAPEGSGLSCKEIHETTFRFAPPPIITRDQVAWTLERIERVFRAG